MKLSFRPAAISAALLFGLATHAHAQPQPPAPRSSERFNVETFGARGDGANDDTAALQAAVNAAKAAGGGVVALAPGKTYRCATTLNFNGAHNVTLDGATSHYEGTNSARLLYTGAGANSFITLRPAFGVNLRNLKIEYDNPAFTGILIEADWPVGGRADVQYLSFDHCTFTGSRSATRAAALVSLNHAIIVDIRNCHFLHARYGIRGIEAAPAYSYVVRVDNCIFNFISAAIYNIDSSWLITGCTFEPDDRGQVVAIDQEFDHYARALTFENNWVGDAGVATQAQIRVMPLGATFANNWFTLPYNGRAIELHKAQGVTLTGNRFETNPPPRPADPITSNCLNLATPTYALSVNGNSFNCALPITNAAGAAITGYALLANETGGAPLTNLIGNGLTVFENGNTLPGSAASVTLGSTSEVTTPGPGAALRWLNGVPGYAYGGLGIQARSDLDAPVYFLSGNPPAARAAISGAGLQLLDGTPLVASGSVQIGGGTAIKRVLAGAATLDFGPTPAAACDALTIKLDGARDGDVVSLGVPAALAAAGQTSLTAYVSAPNVVTVKRCNLAATRAPDPAPAAVRVQLSQF